MFTIPTRVIRRCALPLVVSMCTWTALAAQPKVARAALPGLGLKTPGIRIPFSNIEPEARISVPSQADWLFFSEALYLPGPNGTQQIDPKTNKPKPIAGLEKACGGMAAGFGSLWVPLCGEGVLARVDAKALTVKERVATGAAANLRGTVVATSDSIWALVDEKVTLSRIDPDKNVVVAELRLPVGCHSLTFGETALWVACPAENKVLRINPATNLVEKRIDVAAQPIALAVGQGSIWTLCAKDGKVDRIDPNTNKVTKSIELGAPQTSGGLAFSDGSLWVSLVGLPLSRIDPKLDAVAQQFPGTGGGVIEASPGTLWILQPKAGSLLRIDPKLVVMTLAE